MFSSNAPYCRASFRLRGRIFASFAVTLAVGCAAPADDSGSAADAQTNDVQGGSTQDGSAASDVLADEDASSLDGTSAGDVAIVADALTSDALAVDGAGDDDGVSTGDIGPVCPGGPGCSCATDKDCSSAPCLAANHDDGGAVSRCAQPCASVDACAAGWSCAKVQAFGAAFFCVQPTAKLCAPCSAATDCAMSGAPFSACVSHGAAGSFCGIACATDKACPDDYSCENTATVAGKSSKQCVPKGGGACACSAVAVVMATQTTCFAPGLPGCTAIRTCAIAGGSPKLSDCAPAAPTQESCDGVDSNCDGQPDPPSLCVDGNACTEDDCAGTKGCKFTPDSASPCDDGDACTTKDSCKNGVCAAKKTNCDDDNGCTTDGCDLATGCTHTAADAPCDDANACTTADVCLAGACTATAIDCDDKQPCTVDSCAPLFGCKYAFTKDACDDGDVCTTKDQCVGGSCKGGPALGCDDADLCTDDACDLATGCTHTFNTGTCNDGDPCNLGERCDNGKCKGGTPRPCDDNNVCTDDPCVVVGAVGLCKHATNTAACSDGNLCTGPDACLYGQCKGKTLNCNDSNPCTSDSCDLSVGCTHTNNVGACVDGNACTTGDTCKNGACTGAKRVCDDGNSCTNDGCDMALGCTKVNNTDACDDGDPCLGPDKCAGGACSGKPVGCNDGNACTKDACKPATKGGKPGCSHAPIAGPCPDGDPCTTDEACDKGVCKTTPNVCSDGKKCTTDACDPKAGCSHKPIVGCTDVITLPIEEPFDCNGPATTAWKLGSSLGSTWAVDASPKLPTPKSPSCSLNFNNGVDYQCKESKIDASAESPWFNVGAAIGATFVVSFELSGTWEPGVYDVLDVDVSEDGAKWTTALKSLDHETAAEWKLTTFKYKPVSKQFKIRFRFHTQDCQFNAMTGPFIDDLRIARDGCTANVDCPAGPCQTAVCDGTAKKCKTTPKADGSSCADGSKCVEAACKAGTCIAKTTKKCASNDACVAVSCAADTGQCSVLTKLTGAPCDDGDGCTSKSECKVGECKGVTNAPPACDDGESCTSDTCKNVANKPVCAHKALADNSKCDDGDACSASSACASGKCTASGAKLCALSETFDCGKATGWVVSPSAPEPAVGWHVDATPAKPGFFSASCSLNFNGGKDYVTKSNGGRSSGSATSPEFTLPSGALVLQFRSFHDVETDDDYDKRSVLVSLDNFKTTLYGATLKNSSESQGKWNLFSIPLPKSAAGKKLRIRFAFDSVDGLSNTTTGWWIDDVKIAPPQAD